MCVHGLVLVYSSCLIKSICDDYALMFHGILSGLGWCYNLEDCYLRSLGALGTFPHVHVESIVCFESIVFASAVLPLFAIF